MNKKFKFSKILLLVAFIFGLWVISISKMFKLELAYQVLIGLGGVVILYGVSSWLLGIWKGFRRSIDWVLDNTPIEVLLGGSAGLLVGIVVGVLSSFSPFYDKRHRGLSYPFDLLHLRLLRFKDWSRRAHDVFRLLPLSTAESTFISRKILRF